MLEGYEQQYYVWFMEKAYPVNNPNQDKAHNQDTRVDVNKTPN